MKIKQSSSTGALWEICWFSIFWRESGSSAREYVMSALAQLRKTSARGSILDYQMHSGSWSIWSGQSLNFIDNLVASSQLAWRCAWRSVGTVHLVVLPKEVWQALACNLEITSNFFRLRTWLFAAQSFWGPSRSGWNTGCYFSSWCVE